ncbi:MAG: hypothetical protein C0490_17100, partial [Marivirga sp.]|nr:hypothetical protein [Marivirga sp.]
PKLFLRFFRWFCHPKLLKYIEGDLMELYDERLKKLGKRPADVRFIFDVLLLFRPGIIRPSEGHNNINQLDMLTNYFKVGVRNILKNRVYSSINVFGLAVGMAASILIMLYIADELSYDHFLKDSDRIFRIGSRGSFEGSEFTSAVSSPPLAHAVLQQIPEVNNATRFALRRALPMRYNDQAFIEKHTLVADSNFFQFFSFPLVSGDPSTVLKGINKIVITESTAKRYFGEEDPMGKIILIGEDKTATEIAGIAKDIPSNSHIQFDMVLSAESWSYMKIDQWSNTFLYTYVKTNSFADAPVVKKKLDVLTEKKMGPELEKIIGITMDQFKAKGDYFDFFLQPMLDIHLRSDLSSEITPNGSIQYVYIFGVVALFILLIACINFMNLSTARSATRAKEVGVRKSIGAVRSLLMGQFLWESMIYSFISAFFALAIIGSFLEPFNKLIGKQLEFNLFTQPLVLFGIVAFALITGLIAGSYPAFYLTAFKPIDVLKGKVSAGLKSSGLRNSLVIFQFMISIALIFGSIIVYKQLKYMQGKNMGFNKENVIDLNNGWSVGDKTEAFKNELFLQPEFRSASFVSGLPPNIVDSNLFRKGGTEQDIVLHVCSADYDLLSVMGYSMAAGRFFSPDFPSDSSAVILNETAFRQLQFSQLEGQTIINFNAR